MPTGPGRSPSTHNENPPQRGSNRTDWPNNPGYTDTRFPPQPSIQRFRSAGTTEYPYHGFGTESGPAFPQRPAPEPQWDSTVFVDLVANKWRLQSADRKELHEFAKVGFISLSIDAKLLNYDSGWPQHTEGLFCGPDLFLHMPARHEATTHWTLGVSHQYKKGFCRYRDATRINILPD